MSAPSPKAGKLDALLGNCDHTGVNSRDNAKMAISGLDLAGASFN
jgi:hypothetical protein